MSERTKLELKELSIVTLLVWGSIFIVKVLYDYGIINLYVCLAFAIIIFLMMCYYGVKRMKKKRSCNSYKKYEGDVKELIVYVFGALIIFGIKVLYENTIINNYVALVLTAANLFMISFYLRYKKEKWLDSIQLDDETQ